MSETAERFIPYHATAEAMAGQDDSPALFLRSLFPDATDEQVAQFEEYTAGKILDGIYYGLEATSNEPVAPIEAYRFGRAEGYEDARRELTDGGIQ
ncbi:MAG TPA: hypothetical protein VM124_01595 [Candidatus Limnocylindrales bacterium]|nr:hypothetical protein [Candidatus Limnocylindrales bacterium]